MFHNVSQFVIENFNNRNKVGGNSLLTGDTIYLADFSVLKIRKVKSISRKL